MKCRTSISFSSAADSAMCFPFAFVTLKSARGSYSRFADLMVATGSGSSPFSVSRMTVSPRSPTSVPRCVLLPAIMERGHDARALAGESLVILRPHQRPFEPCRLDFERVRQFERFQRAVDARRDAFAQRPDRRHRLYRCDGQESDASPRLRARALRFRFPERSFVRDRVELMFEHIRQFRHRHAPCSNWVPNKKARDLPTLTRSNRLHGTENDDGPQPHVGSGPSVETSYANFCAVAGYVQLASAPVAPLSVRVFAGHMARWILRFQPPSSARRSLVMLHPILVR